MINEISNSNKIPEAVLQRLYSLLDETAFSFVSAAEEFEELKKFQEPLSKVFRKFDEWYHK